MRFTFGPTNAISKILYLVGIPIVLLMFFDRLLGWQVVSQETNLKVFLLGAILVALGGLVNITSTIFQNLNRSQDH